jgi:hypothetical protein
MARPGPKCTVCTHPKRKLIERDGRLTRARPSATVKYGVSLAALNNHMSRHLEPSTGTLRVLPGGALHPTSPAPPPPTLADNATPLERARATSQWLQTRLTWASSQGRPEKELAHLAGQCTNATRLLARLSGSLEVTEAQVVRSLPFSRIIGVMREALRPYPKALEAVVGALERFNSGEG